MKVVIINGYPMSGKSQFCAYCMDYMTKKGIKGGIISTVDLIKNIASQLGWDGIKTPKDRKFLSDLKKLLTDWNDIPFTYVQSQIRETYLMFTQKLGVPQDRIIFFVHSREPEEIKRFQEVYGATTLLVKRKDVEDLEQSNDSDNNVMNFQYDYTINNDKGLDELQLEAIKFIDEMVKF